MLSYTCGTNNSIPRVHATQYKRFYNSETTSVALKKIAIMDTNKYPKPKLPTTQQVLEDLFDPDVVTLTGSHEISKDELLRNAYNCYRDSKQLQQDILRQNELNANLDNLHEQLNKSINDMKQQKVINK